LISTQWTSPLEKLQRSYQTLSPPKNLAQQLRHSAIVALLSKSLAEEENADQLLNQVARSLMSVAKMPAAVEQTE
jgi:Mn-containing catalase